MNEFQHRPRRSFAAILFVAYLAVAAAGYWSVLKDPAAVLAFNDGAVEFALSPTFRFPAALIRLWDNQFYFGAGNRQASINVSSIAESVFGPHQYRRLFPALLLALCGMAAFWCLRSFGLRREVCALTGGIVLLSAPAYHFAMLGLPVRPTAMAFSFLAIGFAERGRQTNRWTAYALVGGFLGLAVSDVADVGAFYALTSAAVIALTHIASWRARGDAIRFVFRMLVIAATSVLLAWQTLDVMFRTQIVGVTQGVSPDATEEAKYDWATQWSLPKAESWSIVSGSYFGSSIRSKTSPYWGKVGRSAGWESTRQGFRNFALTGWGISAAAAWLWAAFVISLIRSFWMKNDFPSKPLAWTSLVGCLLTLMLSWGRYFPLYRLLYALPFFSTVRNPEKWNGPFTLLAVIGIALFLEQVFQGIRQRDADALRHLRQAAWGATACLGTVALLILIYTIAHRDRLLEHLLAEEYGQLASVAVAHAVAVSWKTLLLLLATGVTLAAAIRSVRHSPKAGAGVLFVALGLLVAGDQLYTNSMYVMPHRYSALTRPNPLITHLEAAGYDRRMMLLPARHPVLNNLRLTLLAIPGFDLFDPVSVSRMPRDYSAFFSTLNDRPIRLWELGSIRFFLTFPDAVAQLNALDGNRGRFVERLALGLAITDGLYVPTDFAAPRDRILRLVEFTGALAKHRWVPAVESFPTSPEEEETVLRKLASPEFDPIRVALVHGACPPVSPRQGTSGIRVLSDRSVETRLEVELDEPAMMVRSVRYDPDWQVMADGQRLDLLRVNSLFQGAVIPAGSRVVEWSYKPPLGSMMIALAGRLAMLLGLLRFACAGRPRKNSSEETCAPSAAG